MIRIVTEKKLDKLKADLKIDMLEIFKSSFKEFTDDVVACISNHLQGVSGVLSQRPCEQHSMDIEELKKKYMNHEERILILEKEVKQLKNQK